MAAYSVKYCKHATLSSTTVDTVTLTGGAPVVEVYNADASNPIYFCIGDSTGGSNLTATPTAAGDDTYKVPPATARQVLAPPAAGANGDVSVKLIGNGNIYSVHSYLGASL